MENYAEKSAYRKLGVPALLSAVRRRALYILIPAVIFAGAAWRYAQKRPQNFRARVEIAAEPVVPANYLSDRPTVTPVVNVTEQLRAIRDVLLNPVMLRSVIDEVGYGPTREGQQAVDEMRAKIQIQVDTQDSFFVSLEGPKAQQTMEAVNRLTEKFVDKTHKLLGQRTQQVDTFLDTEVSRLRKQLDQQEQGLAGYKQSVSQALPDRVATSLKHVETVQQEIQAENDHIAEAQARRSAVADELKTLEKQGALAPEPAAKTPAETALDEARNKLRQLQARYTPENPLVRQGQKEVKELEAAVASQNATQAKVQRPPSQNQMRSFALQAELKSIDERVKSYAQERDTLRAELQRAESQVSSSPGYEGAIDRLSKDAAVTRSRYEALLARQQEAKLDQRAGQAGNGIVYRIVEPASLPSAPSGPKRYQIVLLGLVAGLGLGFGMILLREQMDSSFGTVEEFEGYTNLPVLAAVPTIRNHSLRRNGAGNSTRKMPQLVPPDRGTVAELDRKHLYKHRVTVMSDPHSVPSEQYRILMLKILKWLQSDEKIVPGSVVPAGKTLAVTSAAGGEGKSVTALNLSLALASSIRGRVLLIDADLWRPRVSQYLGLNSARGITDLLADPDGDIDSYITRVSNLDVIPGGTGRSDPVGLLGSPQAGQVLQQLQEKYRLIVLDSPPIVPAADSHMLASLANGVLLVLRARRTKRELFRRAIESLGASNVLGVVLNDVNYRDTPYANAYSYYHRECVGGR